ncbi:hypothetical protein ACG33_15090 [Steroidobacter denitrificans]|uniref:DUF3325 domain-containing protein n=1 Tax=Steroidobacter denitrificans TaxID=465721 RepID=A0A127FEP7_STEDE|nr:hypothetical protein [Steroidobacter denitrificans]AMN48399.1 hypothetical protein ACG33_15090 [Steroidobacter denitrificans]
MTAWLSLLAMLSGTGAAALFYLASPQQQWRAAGPWPARQRWWPGCLCALLSLIVMTRLLAPKEAAFAWCVLLMFGGSVAPFLGAWRARAGKSG